MTTRNTWFRPHPLIEWMLPHSGSGGRRKEQWNMTDYYSLWVDLPNKLISPVEVSGFSKFAYESQEALDRVMKLLFADGYRLRAA